MPPQRKRKATESDAAAAVGLTTETEQQPPSLRRSTRKIPVKPAPVDTKPAPKRRRAANSRAITASNSEVQVVTETANQATNQSINVPPKEKAKSRAKGKGIAKAKKEKVKPRAKGKGEAKAKDDQAVDDDYREARWRPHPPKPVVDRMLRCRTQRMFIIDRNPVKGANPPQERFRMAGTTGNVYTIYITNRPSCTCPDGKRSGTCKHILYVMIKALRAREDLVYQIALTNKELREIYANAPTPGATAPAKSAQKPLDEDDCPICYSEFDAKQAVVFCRAMCGTNIHKDCFDQWAATKGPDGVTCVMCRTKWEYEDIIPGVETVDLGNAKKNSEGYRNIGSQLGLNQERHYDPNSWMGNSWYPRS